ncbi:MAG TPA: T9SS type A sorting domain-containing protein [Bacteroidales bacterium]|nr:T9SS type A sorting domain-containing protein [Bacteroidales bacterium]
MKFSKFMIFSIRKYFYGSFILLNLISINVFGQFESFIYYDGETFMENCETFYPKVIAYPVHIHKDINNEYHVSAWATYCEYNQSLGCFTSGSNATAWNNSIYNHLVTIANMGFNTIRINGLSVKVEKVSSNGSYKLISNEVRHQAENLYCTAYNSIFEVNSSSYYIQFELIEELIDIVKLFNADHPNTPLRVSFITGIDVLSLVSEEYKLYLEALGEYFRDEKTIFSWEIQTEPEYQAHFPLDKDKIETAQDFTLWYDALKTADPNHFITFGVEPYDLFYWDAELFTCDYLNFHSYQSQYLYNNPTLIHNRQNSFFKWFSNVYNKPWIIGETNLAADDELHATVSFPYFATEEEQREYLEFNLKQSTWYGSYGLTVWLYKDWGYDGVHYGSKFGLVKMIEAGQPEIIKEGADAIINFNPNDECITCVDPEPNFYYNMDEYTDLVASGTVYDDNNQPIQNAIIRAYSYIPSYNTMDEIYENSYINYTTFTNEDGEFNVKRDPNSTVYLFRVSKPGYDLNSLTVNIPPFQSLPNVTIELEKLDPIESTYIDENIITISEGLNITWDLVTSLNAEKVIIEPGAKLEITADIYVKPNAKFIVQRGGKLVIDNGSLIGHCLWQGIEVWGTASQPQSIAYQGVVEIKNGGTIENAACGIQTIRYAVPDGGEGEAPDYYYTGGIVLADGAVFRNNEIAVKFWPYDDAPAVSYFRECTFVTDEDINTGASPDKFIEMNGITGIRVMGSTFTDERTEISPQQLTTGIHSTGAKFYVNPQGEQQSVFTNLHYGIEANSIDPLKNAEITDNLFQTCFRGVYLSGMSGAIVTGNNFSIDAPYSQFNGGYGLYLDYSTGYTIEDNYFFHEWTQAKGVGLIVNESGGEPNQIYRNWFTNLECGMDLQGKNRATDGSGLELKCNQYEGTVYDKIITWDLPVINKEAGVAMNQGSSTSTPEAMAGNLFQIDDYTNPDGNFDDILDQANSITYYYPQNNDDLDVIPVDFTANVSPVGVGQFTWTFEDGCPPEETGGGGGSEEGLRESITQSNLSIDSTENLLALLIDGGNTEVTQTDVETSIPPETMQVYNDLMNKSPYLSDTVVSTAIEKEDVLPGAMIRDIMVANPNTAKSEALMNKLDERWDPLPEYMKAQILQGRSIVSIREETESVLAARKLKKAKYFNALVRLYLEDTLNPQASIDSLKMLLQQEHSLHAKYRLAMMSLEQGAWSEGLGVLNSIPAQFELTSSAANEHLQFTALYNLMSNIAQQGKTVFEADSTTMVSLMEIEAGNNGMASAYARNILLALDQVEYEEPILFPDMLKSAIAQDEYNTLISKSNEAPGYLRIKPNPAKDYFIVEYELEQETTASIDITDILGNLKNRLNVFNKQDEVTVDTQDWKPGIYIATLKINRKPVESVKFTITD